MSCVTTCDYLMYLIALAACPGSTEIMSASLFFTADIHSSRLPFSTHANPGRISRE